MIVRQYHLFTRDRRPGTPVLVAQGVFGEELGLIARGARLPSCGIGELLEADVFRAEVVDEQGVPMGGGDLFLAAYHFFAEQGLTALKRIRFATPHGDVEVQQEVFRPLANAQIWREAGCPRILEVTTDGLASLLGLHQHDLLRVQMVELAPDPPCLAIVVKDLEILHSIRSARVGEWLDEQQLDRGFNARVAIYSRVGSSPLFDGQMRLFHRDGLPRLPEGSAAAGVVAHRWQEDPSKSAYTVEVADEAGVIAHVTSWIEGSDGQISRISLGGHVRFGSELHRDE